MPEAVAWRCSIKWVFLKISQNSEFFRAFSFLQASACNFIKKDSGTSVILRIL